jgi:fluoride exporter
MSTLTQALIAVSALAGGSAAGGVMRFWVSGVVARRFGETFPWGTMAVNLSGAFAAGWLGALIIATRVPDMAVLFLLSGFLGSYTTVSSLSLQTLLLTLEGQCGAALGNLAFTVLVGLAAVASGFALGAMIHA